MRGQPDGITAENEDSRAPLTPVLAVAAVVLIAGGIWAAHWMLYPFHRKWDLADLAVYRAAAKAIMHGHSVFGSYVAQQLRVPLPFIYPPIAAVFFVPFAMLPETPANILWTALTVVLLAGVIRVCFAPLLARYKRSQPVVWLLALGAMAAMAPVEDHLRFGQVGIALMACCVFDCALPKTRWPRGLLVGIAAASKLVPAVFIPYLVLTRRFRAAFVSIATFLALGMIGLIVAPSDSWNFWTDKMFQPTNPTFFTNQSLEGMLERAIGPWRLVWLPAVAFVMIYGLLKAAAFALSGDQLRGIAITGLVGVLVSPISWIHHLVWIIPALGVIVGSGTDKKRVAIAIGIAALFVVRLPYVGNEQLGEHGFFAHLLEDAYGLVCLGVFIYLTHGRARARNVVSRAWLRTPATASAGSR